MREFNTLKKEEIIEFINKIDIGTFKISKFKYIKSEKTFEARTKTEWVTEDDNNKEVKIIEEDMWSFTQDSFDTDYPLDTSYNLLYFEFLLAKGFKENSFKD